MTENDGNEKVRRLAYTLWEAAGRPEGEHVRFWHEAERRLKGDATAEDELEEGLEESFPASDAAAAVMRHEQ